MNSEYTLARKTRFVSLQSFVYVKGVLQLRLDAVIIRKIAFKQTTIVWQYLCICAPRGGMDATDGHEVLTKTVCWDSQSSGDNGRTSPTVHPTAAIMASASLVVRPLTVTGDPLSDGP